MSHAYYFSPRPWTRSTVAVAIGQERRTGAFDQSINHPAIKYLTADTDTVVDRLNQKLRDGSAKLVFDEKTGYLKSVLELLQVPVESQVMVYTQTSLQAQHIRMNNPRAIYFNDTVSVGYIRGAGLDRSHRAGSERWARSSTRSAKSPRRRRRSGAISSACAVTCRGTRSACPGLSVLTTFPRKSESDYANGGSVDHYRPI